MKEEIYVYILICKMNAHKYTYYTPIFCRKDECMRITHIYAMEK